MRFLSFTAACGLAIGVLPSLGAAQELLTNPSFEQSPNTVSGPHGTPIGWTLEELPRVPAQAGPYRGDYNNGGVSTTPCLPSNYCNAVDAADYTVWRDNLGTNFMLPNRHTTLSGPVNQFDYDIWKADFGFPRTADLAQSANFSHIAFKPLGSEIFFDVGGLWSVWFEPYNGTNSGNPDNETNLTQTVPGTPGLTYTMEAHALFEDYFPGGVVNLNATNAGTPTGAPFDDGPASPTDTYFGLDFLDSTGAVLTGSVQIELKAAGQPSNTTWMKHTLVGTAPAGTTQVRVRATMTDGVTNPLPNPQVFQMSAFVDLFSLTASGGTSNVAAVPEPTSCIVLLGAVGLLVAYRRS
jgi:hypothetical protein